MPTGAPPTTVWGAETPFWSGGPVVLVEQAAEAICSPDCSGGEWSDIPRRRVALTAETCHQAFTWSSALTASSSRSSRRLPRVGARTFTCSSASRGGIGGSLLDT
jgi:hypothetical protein